METIYESSLRKLKEKTQNIEINAKTIINVVRFAMEIVEVTTLKGKEQKELVEKLVRQIIKDAPITDGKEEALLYMVDEGIIGDITELVVSASKGELNVNAVIEVSKICCLGFCR
jgi:predicted ATP-dependent protease